MFNFCYLRFPDPQFNVEGFSAQPKTKIVDFPEFLYPAPEHLSPKLDFDLSLNKDSPASRTVESFGCILPVPILGGLHLSLSQTQPW